MSDRATHTEPYIMVMIRNTKVRAGVEPFGEWSMDRAYSISYLGAAEAVRKAQAYIEELSPLLSNVEFKLEGGDF